MLKNIFNRSKRLIVNTQFRRFYDTNIFRNVSIYETQEVGKYDVKKNLVEYLRSLVIARTYDLRSNIYLEARQNISFLNDTNVKKDMSKLLTNDIKDLSTKELEEAVNLFYDKSKSYETIFDETYYNELANLFKEFGKLLLKNDIYSLDHSVNLREDNKKVLTSLSNIKSIVEDLKLNELNDIQFGEILSTLIMVNNIYSIQSYVSDNLIQELFNRKRFDFYLNFLLVHNQIQTVNNLNYLVNLKDSILSSYNNLNDLLYILTDNIYKYASSEYKTEDYNNAFNQFLENYAETTRYNSQNVNNDVLDKFFYSLHLLAQAKPEYDFDSLAKFLNSICY